MKPVLQIDHLSISFTQYSQGMRQRELPVIRDLSLTLYPGQIGAVVGSSGSGKSLLAHSVLGLLPYNSRWEGSILYEGQPLTQERVESLRGREIVLVPQGVTYLDPRMKVGPQLRRGKRDARSREKSRMALDRYVFPPETEKLYPFALSGGMARRVLLASAVMDFPKLLIADEPTPGLDAQAAQRVLGHFRELSQQGAAVLFITHDLELALTVADRIHVFYAGETVEEAAAELRGAGVSHVVIKCGSRGCYLDCCQEKTWIPAEKDVVCLDTTGAGDSFTAGFLYALSEGKSVRDCAKQGNRWGAKAVSAMGATEWLSGM